MSTPDIGFERYRPLAPRARWARIALVTMIAADVLAVLSGVREYVLLERLETELVTAEELEASDRRQQVVALAQFAVFIFAAIFSSAGCTAPTRTSSRSARSTPATPRARRSGAGSCRS
jgi:hypothetical protein